MTISLINIFLLLLITPLNLSIAKICVTSTIEVHIFNKLPNNLPPLEIHCESKDDDLGSRSPGINEDYYWRFCVAITNRTLFFCRFRWGSKYIVFDAYNDALYCLKDLTVPNLINYCKWEVRSDGFYLEQYNVVSDTYYMTYIHGWQ